MPSSPVSLRLPSSPVRPCLAGIVSAARIAAQKHFASDVFAGGTMGWFIGRYVYDTHMSHLAHKHSSLMPMVVPQIDPYGDAILSSWFSAKLLIIELTEGA